MHRCFVKTDQLLADTCFIQNEEARHLQTVLRAKLGERITLFDGYGHTRLVHIEHAEKRGLQFTADAPVAHHPRHHCHITLFACISKKNRMDWTVEKAVELGVSRIVPVISERTIIRLDTADSLIKAERWSRVAEEAARQCGATWLPEIMPPAAFHTCLSLVTLTRPVFVASLEPDTQPLREALAFYSNPPPLAGLFVGPEGDFTTTELTALRASHAVSVSFGKHVLRAETACLYGLCILNNAWLT